MTVILDRPELLFFEAPAREMTEGEARRHPRVPHLYRPTEGISGTKCPVPPLVPASGVLWGVTLPFVLMGNQETL